MFEFIEHMLTGLKDIVTIQRKDFTEVQTGVNNELEAAIAVYQTAVDDKLWENVKTPKFVNYGTEIHRAVHMHDLSSPNWVVGVLTFLNRLAENVSYCNSVLNSSSGDIVVEGTTYRRISLLRYISTASFAARYARAFLHQLLIEEAIRLKVEEHRRPPYEVRYLEENFNAFLLSLRFMNLMESDFKKTVNAVPDIQYSEENVGAVVDHSGEKTIDPMAFGVIPPDYNIFYFVGMRYMNWRAARHEATVQERDAINHRLIQLRNASMMAHDANLDKAVRVYEDELVRTNNKLAELEEGYV